MQLLLLEHEDNKFSKKNVFHFIPQRTKLFHFKYFREHKLLRKLLYLTLETFVEVYSKKCPLSASICTFFQD